MAERASPSSSHRPALRGPRRLRPIPPRARSSRRGWARSAQGRACDALRRRSRPPPLSAGRGGPPSPPCWSRSASTSPIRRSCRDVCRPRTGRRGSSRTSSRGSRTRRARACATSIRPDGSRAGSGSRPAAPASARVMASGWKPAAVTAPSRACAGRDRARSGSRSSRSLGALPCAGRGDEPEHPGILDGRPRRGGKPRAAREPPEHRIGVEEERRRRLGLGSRFSRRSVRLPPPPAFPRRQLLLGQRLKDCGMAGRPRAAPPDRHGPLPRRARRRAPGGRGGGGAECLPRPGRRGRPGPCGRGPRRRP